jgi:hypothetical protein
MTYPDPYDAIFDDFIRTLRDNRVKVIKLLQEDPGGAGLTHRELEVILGDVRAEMRRSYKIVERE